LRAPEIQIEADSGQDQERRKADEEVENSGRSKRVLQIPGGERWNDTIGYDHVRAVQTRAEARYRNEYAFAPGNLAALNEQRDEVGAENTRERRTIGFARQGSEQAE
jgi:hypothetical protein